LRKEALEKETDLRQEITDLKQDCQERRAAHPVPRRDQTEVQRAQSSPKRRSHQAENRGLGAKGPHLEPRDGAQVPQRLFQQPNHAVC